MTTTHLTESSAPLKTLLAGTVAFTMMLAVGCGNGEESEGGGDGGAAETEEWAHPQVIEDLEGARQAVLDGLEEFGADQTQFFLADDVSAPERNYGMWVLPIERSEETAYITQQIDIDNGSFTIEGEAAEDGTVYIIDQDGDIEEES